jgi:hypothetical protein
MRKKVDLYRLPTHDRVVTMAVNLANKAQTTKKAQRVCHASAR